MYKCFDWRLGHVVYTRWIQDNGICFNILLKKKLKRWAYCCGPVVDEAMFDVINVNYYLFIE